MFDWLLAAAFAADLSASLHIADGPRAALAGARVAVHATFEVKGEPARETDLTLYVGRGEEALAVFHDDRGRTRKILTHGNETWLIVPGTRHPVRMPPAQRLFGAASLTDLARLHLARDYDATLVAHNASCGTDTCQEATIVARNDRAPYPTGTILLNSKSYLHSATFRVASGKPAKSLLMTYRHDADGRTLPARMVITDLLNAKQPTVTTLDYGFPVALDDDPKRFDREQLAAPKDPKSVTR